MTDWYLARAGELHGPVSLAELKELVDSGELTGSDLVWQDAFTDWVQASVVGALFPRSDQSKIPSLPSNEARAKAERNYLHASSKLSECRAHLKVYGRRREANQLALDGLEFIDAALSVDPSSSRYWNLKGLLLADGLHEGDEALECFRKALDLEPDSIVVKQNIRHTEEWA